MKRGLTPLSQHLLEQLRKGVAAAPTSGPDLRWATKIVERANAGETINPTTLKFARDALAGRGRVGADV